MRYTGLLDDFHKGDPLSASHSQQAVTALRAHDEVLARLDGGGDPSPNTKPRLAVVIDTPSGQSAYTDARYYARWQYLDAADPDAALTTRDEADEPSVTVVVRGENVRYKEPNYLTVTNLLELPFGSHSLAVGQRIWVWRQFDRDNRPTSASKAHNVTNAAPLTAMVKVTGSASGGGKYTGTICGAPTADVAATGNLTDAEVGSGSIVCRILNTREVGQSTHDLASAAFLPLVFLGRLVRVNSDNTPVFAIDGFQHENCT